jgi:hypothetical protein
MKLSETGKKCTFNLVKNTYANPAIKTHAKAFFFIADLVRKGVFVYFLS